MFKSLMFALLCSISMAQMTNIYVYGNGGAVIRDDFVNPEQLGNFRVNANQSMTGFIVNIDLIVCECPGASGTCSITVYDPATWFVTDQFSENMTITQQGSLMYGTIHLLPEHIGAVVKTTFTYTCCGQKETVSYFNFVQGV